MCSKSVIAASVATLFLISATVAMAQQENFKSIPEHVTPQSMLEIYQLGFGVTGFPKSARRLSPITIELIKYYEKWEPEAYNDASDYCTIGYGHLIALRPCSRKIVFEFKDKFGVKWFDGDRLTEAGGLQLLEQDTVYARRAVEDGAAKRGPDHELRDYQFGALASFVFNVGVENFNSSTLLKRLQANEDDLVSAQFPNWIKSKHQVLLGLIRRRSCERVLFDGKMNSSSHFSHSTCEAFGAAPPSSEQISIESGE